MSEWLKIIVAAVATIIGVYGTIVADVKDHGHRIDRLEDWSEKHDERHQTQWDKIDGRLSRIEIALGIGRMASDGSDRGPMASSIAGAAGRK